MTIKPATPVGDDKAKDIAAEIRLLSQAQKAFEAMLPDVRQRAFNWFRSKYSKEWPHEPTY